MIEFIKRVQYKIHELDQVTSYERAKASDYKKESQ